MLLRLPPIARGAANGAPIHVLDIRGARASSSAQTASLLLHVASGGAIFLAIAFFQNYPAPRPWFRGPLLEFPVAADANRNHVPHLGKDGGGGNNNPIPATRGNLAPFSRMQLLPPRLPDAQRHPLTVQPTLPDDQAPDIAPIVTNLGLPSATDPTASAGSGQNGIGNRGKGGMGNRDGDGTSIGNEPGPYSAGLAPVTCAYCPDPLYTDEARKAKLQGRVLLRVLVGADGRASDIRVVAPLGLGLDERAVETVRTWGFIPARDASRNPVPSWVTIETIYRLF